ncbi:hypothetical protein [Kordia jejudonensis]|uniref:hypothetical protein n=1 Tax=Kordia jejudonensis TaxID=1348245 RepID=UPI00062915AC|nr:hypothetical protein [Kordia jejudonensis]
MTVKDFFIMVLKIMGIYFFIDGILPLVLELIFYSTTDHLSDHFWFIGCILLFFAIIYFMISHSETLAKFLRLDCGFSTERFDFSKADSAYIIEIAIAIMGLYMLFYTIPFILIDGYVLFKSNVNSRIFSVDKSPETLQLNLITNFLYILVGLVILLLRKPISSIFTPNTNKK